MAFLAMYQQQAAFVEDVDISETSALAREDLQALGAIVRVDVRQHASVGAFTVEMYRVKALVTGVAEGTQEHGLAAVYFDARLAFAHADVMQLIVDFDDEMGCRLRSMTGQEAIGDTEGLGDALGNLIGVV